MSETRVPILRLGHILLASIQVDLTDAEAEEFQADIVNRVVDTEVGGVIIDITTLDVVDSFLARILNDTSEMLYLVGAKTVISGMRPAVAITLIDMGRGIMGVETALDLDQGVEKLQRMMN